MASTSCSASLAMTYSAAWSSRSPTMCGCAPRRGRRGSDPPLRRDALRRQVVDGRSTRCRADRGDHASGLDIRYVVTSLTHGSAEWLYDSLYCARGQAQNLIKLHNSQLASDRT